MVRTLRLSASVRRSLNQGREETVDAMCAKNVIGHGQAQRGRIHGPEHFKQFLHTFLRGFSDIHVETPRRYRAGR